MGIRVRDDDVQVQMLKPDGSWVALPLADLWKVCADGRQVATEAEALEEAREIFALRGQPHALCRPSAGSDGAGKNSGADSK